jgi:hypothetical protein
MITNEARKEGIRHLSLWVSGEVTDIVNSLEEENPDFVGEVVRREIPISVMKSAMSRILLELPTFSYHQSSNSYHNSTFINSNFKSIMKNVLNSGMAYLGDGLINDKFIETLRIRTKEQTLKIKFEKLDI